MNVSVRSYLVAGAAAATATTLALTSVQMTPEDVAISAHPVSAEPQLSQAMVDLLAAAGRMTAALPAPPQPPGTDTPTGSIAPAAVTPPGDVTVQNAASDFVTWAYTGIQEWVDWGVDYASDIAYWLGSWGVPFAGAIGWQIDTIYFGLIQPIADSVVFDLINPVLNAPLNLGVWVNGAIDVGYSVFASLVNTGLAELDYFFGWILPPLPPPLPIGLTETMASTLAAPMASVGPVRSLIGDIVLPPVDFATDAFTGGFSGLLDVSQAVTGGTIDAIEPVLDRLGLDVVNDQLKINYNLLNNLSIQEVGFVNDLVSVPSEYLHDVLEEGQGPLRALAAQADAVVDSATEHGAASVDAIGQYVRDQVDAFTPRTAATDADTADVARVPATVKTSLAPDTETTGTTETKETKDTKPVRSLAKNVRDAKAGFKADVKKATENVRQAVKDARDGLANASEKAGKKDKAEKKSEPKTEKKESESSDKE